MNTTDVITTIVISLSVLLLIGMAIHAWTAFRYVKSGEYEMDIRLNEVFKDLDNAK